MLDRLRRFANPGNAACLAGVLIAVGVEIEEPMAKHALEILGAVIALAGFFLRSTAARAS